MNHLLGKTTRTTTLDSALLQVTVWIFRAVCCVYYSSFISSLAAQGTDSNRMLLPFGYSFKDAKGQSFTQTENVSEKWCELHKIKHQLLVNTGCQNVTERVLLISNKTPHRTLHIAASVIHSTPVYTELLLNVNVTRGQSNLTKSASRGSHSPVRGHPGGRKLYHWIPGVGFPISVP